VVVELALLPAGAAHELGDVVLLEDPRLLVERCQVSDAEATDAGLEVLRCLRHADQGAVAAGGAARRYHPAGMDQATLDHRVRAGDVVVQIAAAPVTVERLHELTPVALRAT